MSGQLRLYRAERGWFRPKAAGQEWPMQACYKAELAATYFSQSAFGACSARALFRTCLQLLQDLVDSI